MNLVSNPLGRVASQCIHHSRQILSRAGNRLTRFKLRGLSGWTLLGLVTGILLFISITTQANPAMAQLFDTVEGQAQNIFGQYLDGDIISFMFGLLRLVVWVSAVGFVFFAVYQAQRGEQWQPLLQNAFIIIAAVVIVEGLSRLFFGA
jgi:hypothetical protein